MISSRTTRRVALSIALITQRIARLQGSRAARLLCLGLMCACAARLIAAAPNSVSPDARSLLGAPSDNANWILPARTYAGNRYTTLSQVNKTNAGTLGQAWRTAIADDGEQEASIIVWKGTM